MAVCTDGGADSRRCRCGGGGVDAGGAFPDTALFHGGGRCATGNQSIVCRLGLRHIGDGVADLHSLALGGHNVQEAAVDDLVVDGVFLILKLHHHVALGNLSALADFPLGDGALHHGQACPGHGDLHHAFSRRGSRCGSRRGGRGFRGGGCPGQGGQLLRAFRQDADGLAHRDGVALLGQNVNIAVSQRVTLNGVLFVFVFHQGIALFHVGSLGYQPLGDGTLHHGQSRLGHYDRCTHCDSPFPRSVHHGPDGRADTVHIGDGVVFHGDVVGHGNIQRRDAGHQGRPARRTAPPETWRPALRRCRQFCCSPPPQQPGGSCGWS